MRRASLASAIRNSQTILIIWWKAIHICFNFLNAIFIEGNFFRSFNIVDYSYLDHSQSGLPGWPGKLKWEPIKLTGQPSSHVNQISKTYKDNIPVQDQILALASRASQTNQS